jgi:YD repeat-containing protein
MEQTETAYDEDNNVIQTTMRERYHNAVASQAGPLQNPGTTPNARVTYVAQYPDAIGRVVNSANYGTNGSTSLSRPATAPVRSDTILVSSSAFDSAGNVATITDPAGTVTCIEYDALARKITVTQNCVSGSSSSSSFSSNSSSSGGCSPSDDTNAVTRNTYTPDGMQATMTAVNSRLR